MILTVKEVDTLREFIAHNSLKCIRYERARWPMRVHLRRTPDGSYMAWRTIFGLVVGIEIYNSTEDFLRAYS